MYATHKSMTNTNTGYVRYVQKKAPSQVTRIWKQNMA
jgi:hypothetical protein